MGFKSFSTRCKNTRRHGGVFLHLCRKRLESHRPRRCVSCCRRCGDFSLSVIQRRGSGILDLSQDLVDEHSLQSGLTTVSVRGGKIDCPNATGPNQVVIPEGGVFELIASGHETEEEEDATEPHSLLRAGHRSHDSKLWRRRKEHFSGWEDCLWRTQ